MGIKQKLNLIIYNRDYELISSPAKKDMDNFIIQQIFGTLFTLLSAGIFLTGYLLYLGASDNITSFVPQIGNVCGIFLIFFTKFVSRKDKMKYFIITLNLIAKTMIFSIILIPLFLPPKQALIIVYFLIVAGYSVNSITVLAFNTWFVQTIPIKIRGRYFATRQVLSVMISLVVPILAGKTLDLFQNQYYGFLILYIGAIISAFFETYYFSKISNPTIPRQGNSFSIKDIIKTPLKNKKFLSFTVRMCIVQILVNMATSFSNIFMIKYIGLSYTYINILLIAYYFLQGFIFYKFWGILTDRFGANFTLLMSIWFFVADVFFWVFVSSSWVYIFLPLCYLSGAINFSGYTVGVFNRRYELIPEESKVMYESFFTTCMGIAYVVAPIVGGFLRDFFADVSFVNQFEFGNFRVVYLLSAIGLVIIQVINYLNVKNNEPECNCLKKSSYKDSFRILRKIVINR